MDCLPTALPLSAASPFNGGLSQHEFRDGQLDLTAYSGALTRGVPSMILHSLQHWLSFVGFPLALPSDAHRLRRGIENP